VRRAVDGLKIKLHAVEAAMVIVGQQHYVARLVESPGPKEVSVFGRKRFEQKSSVELGLLPLNCSVTLEIPARTALSSKRNHKKVTGKLRKRRGWLSHR
jgi:hypothetical protein